MKMKSALTFHDGLYGAEHVSGKKVVGYSKLDIDQNDNFHINGKKYTGTPGLKELLFMQRPKKSAYDAEDIKVYKSIFETTKRAQTKVFIRRAN